MTTTRNNKEAKQKPDLGGLEDVQTRLYSKSSTIKPYERQGFKNKSAEAVPQTWDKEAVDEAVPLVERKKKTKKRMTLFAKLLIVSILFFLASVFAAFMVFFYGKNEVSYDAVNLAILGPNSISGGEELSFDVIVTNSNPVPLILSDVVVTYPRGTITADAEGLPMGQDIQGLDELRSGFEDSLKFSAILFGKEGEKKDISIVYQYRVPGSDNIFFKERVYEVVVNSAPVVISAEHKDAYQSGDEIELVIDITSNANKRVRNLLLSIDYPFGFEFASSSIDGIDDATYPIGDLRPGESVMLLINGTVSGQDNEERTFRYTLGAQDAERSGVIGSEFTNTDSLITIARPPIDLVLEAEGNPSILYIANSGDEISMKLNYQNTLLSKLIDTELVLTLEGQGYDRQRVDASLGYYRSSDNTINWSRSEDAALAELESGDGGSLLFTIKTQTLDRLAGLIQNPEIVLNLDAQAINLEQAGDEQQVGHSISKRIKLETDLNVEQELLYSVGPLDNSGPIQPTIGQESTYTVHWILSNSTNSVKDTVVKAILPAYVEFENIIAPSQANVTFDARTREVIWNAGIIAAGSGYTLAEKEVFFTVSYEPSLDQLNTNPRIIGDVSVEALDQFTETQVSAQTREIDNRIENDPDYDGARSRVTE